MRRRGKSTYYNHKVKYQGYKFDSEGERDFYIKYLEKSGYRIAVHKTYKVLDLFELGGLRQRSIGYTPDFVVLNQDGTIKHVYDYKSSTNQKYIQPTAKIRFKLFEYRYRQPVQVVTNLSHCFKMTILGFTTSFDTYRMTNIDYDIADYIGM